MRSIAISLLTVAVCAADPAAIATQVGSSAAGDKAKAWIATHGVSLMSNHVLIAAVKAQNAKKVSLIDIQKVDEEWQKAEAPLPIMVTLQTNEAAKHLATVAQAQPALAEAFVMDDQGANVAMMAATSDYWQGDEPKWQNAYKAGAGGVEVGKEKLDKSTNQVIQQISLPLIDGDGAVIGAITLGLAISKL